MRDRYLRRPSGAAGTVVAVAAVELWVDGAVLARTCGRTTVVTDALGHPSRPLVAVVEADEAAGTSRVRVLSIDADGTYVEVHRHAGPLSLAGWWDADTLAVTEAAADAAGPAAAVLVPVCGGPARTREPALYGIGQVDHAPDGRVVMTTSAPRPTHWRGHRGGGAGRVLWLDPASGRGGELPGTGNAADAVVLGTRAYWLDDLGGAVDVHSLPLDAGPGDVPSRHSRLEGVGATSLRRTADALVVGALGRAWVLTPGAGPDDGVWAPVRAEDSEDASDGTSTAAGGRQAGVERVAVDAAGRAAVVAEGAVRRLEHPDDPWTHAAEGGWIADAAWGADGGLRVLEHHDDAAVVRVLGAESGPVVLAGGPAAAGLEWVAHGGGTSVVSGESVGVAVLRGSAPVRWLTEDGAHRRARPAVSADGVRVAWAEQDCLQGGRLVVHDLDADVAASLSVPGMHLWSPVFAPSGDLVFLARRVGPVAGTAAPMERGRVCRVPAASPVAGLGAAHAGVVHAADTPLHELAVADGAVWVRRGDGRWADVADGTRVIDPGPGGIPLAGSDVPAFTDAHGALVTPSASGGRARHVLTPPATPPAAVLAETVRQVRHAVDVAGTEPGGGDAWPGEAAVPAAHPADLAELLDAAAGRAGVSHACILRPPSAARGIAAPLLARAERQLAPHARYLALRDVSLPGWHAVQELLRTWRGDAPLVLDLRFNEGGQFADALLGQLHGLLVRSATAQRGGGPRRPLLTAPRTTAVLIGEYTGSGGEHLAAGLRGGAGVSLWGRRTAGAGTGFHRTRPLTHGLRLALPQYRLGGAGRDGIENHGVDPDVIVPADHAAGVRLDDALLARVQDHLVGERRPSPPTEERGERT